LIYGEWLGNDLSDLRSVTPVGSLLSADGGAVRIPLTSNRHDYGTPQVLFDTLDAEFHFTLDPCASPENAKCKKFYTYHDNGLVQDWSGEVVFMNPPFGRDIRLWMAKAYREALNGITVVCLIPARTDTYYWHEYAMKGEIRYIRGRITFEGMKHNAPFPSAIVIFTGLGL